MSDENGREDFSCGGAYPSAAAAAAAASAGPANDPLLPLPLPPSAASSSPEVSWISECSLLKNAIGLLPTRNFLGQILRAKKCLDQNVEGLGGLRGAEEECAEDDAVDQHRPQHPLRPDHRIPPIHTTARHVDESPKGCGRWLGAPPDVECLPDEVVVVRRA